MNDNTAEKIENEVSEEQLDLEVEIIDDTPEEDKNKERNENAPKDNIPEDDEIAKYKGDAQKRIKELEEELKQVKADLAEERQQREAMVR